MRRKDIQAYGFYQFRDAHKALRALMDFMSRIPPEELAEHIKFDPNGCHWTEDGLYEMRKLPSYVEDLRVELKRLIKADEQASEIAKIKARHTTTSSAEH